MESLIFSTSSIDHASAGQMMLKTVCFFYGLLYPGAYKKLFAISNQHAVASLWQHCFSLRFHFASSPERATHNVSAFCSDDIECIWAISNYLYLLCQELACALNRHDHYWCMLSKMNPCESLALCTLSKPFVMKQVFPAHFDQIDWR